MVSVPSPHLLRHGSPTIDGEGELLYYLKDPATSLRVRLPAAAAHVFSAAAKGISGAGDIARFVAANYGVATREEDVTRYLALFAALRLDAADRELPAQRVALNREIVAQRKAALVARLPEIVKTVPFYEGYAPRVDSFEQIPIIGKTELREHLNRLHVKQEGARYHWFSSSGTTGERVQAPHVLELFDDGVLPNFAAADPALDSDSHWVLFLPAECGGMACNMNPDSPMSDRILGNQLLAPQLGNPSASRTPLLEKCARDMVEWQPEVITGSPSFIYAFARYAESVGLKLPSLRAIFFHVEPASRIHTRRIEAALGAPGRSIYILSELGWLGVERIPGRIFPASGVVFEVVRDGVPVAPGELGHVVITRTAHGSPALIRYDTRDLARLNEDGATISRILGRPHTALVTRPDGARVPMDVVDAAIAEAAAGAIAFYRLYRRGAASSPRFVLDCAASGEGDLERALRGIAEVLGELFGTTVDVRKTSGIPPHRGGRMPLFLDEVEA